MRRIFIKTARIVIALVLVAVAIIFYYSTIATGEEVEMPTVMFFFSFGIISLFAILSLISVIIDMVESYRREGLSFLKKYIVEIVFLGAVFTLYEYFISKSGSTWIDCFIGATVIVCVTRAGSNVIFAKQQR